MTDSVIIEGRRSIVLAGTVELVDESKETAWAGPHVTVRPDFGWVLGRYVEANQANENGHVFGLEALQASYKSVIHTPLNMLHRAHHVVGAYTAAEMLYPFDGAEGMKPDQLAAALEEARALDPVLNPYVETLAAFWRYAFPDEYRSVQEAHAMGGAWQSMECVPEQLECPLCPVEANRYDYRGIQAPGYYCDHLNTFKAQKRLINPHFVGGGLILPPTKPGWKKADLKSVAELVTAHDEEAAAVYDQVVAQAPHLGPREWEYVMALLVSGAFGGEDVLFAAAPAPVKTVTHSTSTMQVPSCKGGIVAPHTTPVAEGPWDRNLMKRRIRTGDANAYRMAYAWYDESGPDPDGDGLPDTKESWKFIHHDVAADGTVGAANMTALRNGIGYLNGARNGTTIPTGDKRGVYDHLAGHLRDHGVTAPPLQALLEGNLLPSALVARAYSREKLEQLYKEGKALPGLHEGDPPRFPIDTVTDLKNAVRAFGRHGGADAKVKKHIMKHARRLEREDLIPPKWMGKERADDQLPPEVFQAYADHLESLGMEESPADEVTVATYAFEGGTLWMVTDGWGEWFFCRLAADEEGDVEWVAQKWPDVMAYCCSDTLGLGPDDIETAGMGDAAWVAMLTERLAELVASGIDEVDAPD